jgi:hypothetical protein
LGLIVRPKTAAALVLSAQFSPVTVEEFNVPSSARTVTRETLVRALHIVCLGVAAVVLAASTFVLMPAERTGATALDRLNADVRTATTPPTTGKYYVVMNSYNGQREFLFEIAQRFLRNGDRWPEIFELNKGRPQPDGLALTKPEVLNPGWILAMPQDAAGKGIETGPLPAVATTSSGPQSSVVPTSAAPVAQAPSSFAWAWWAFLVGAILLMATILVIIRPAWLDSLRVRKPKGSGQSPSSAQVIHDDPGAWAIDRVLRSLATACHQAGRATPKINVVTVGPESVWLGLGSPDQSPPPGWSAEGRGRRWKATLRELQAAPADGSIASPCPRLVSLGDDSEGRVLLNLAQADGLISITGDDSASVALAHAWTRELATSPWSSEVTVVRAGFPADGPAAPNVIEVDHISAASELISDSQGGVILVRKPRSSDHEELTQLSQQPARPWSVIVVGDPSADARWRITLDANGRAESGILMGVVRIRARQEENLKRA